MGPADNAGAVGGGCMKGTEEVRKSVANIPTTADIGAHRIPFSSRYV